ncbi:hypothetical protein [Planosporangium mesophilum]|uniref:IPT/TIG domain-containing protein n=1 Tax=Planosporangium mesophilum TaxID=689768 RepID=A0A8J3TAG4_9ACTN|nr:hypothetical protein [Planosporangium mesophilum]NJC83223.1 hypothetical protein [Planosporangium mesophilum]GII21597.1 hypothetical protein Pme01_11940 [Planosporangium mesophilum]
MANAVRTRSAQSVQEARVRARQNWKRLAILAVALFVVVNLARSVLPTLGVKTPLGGQRPTSGTTTQAGTPPPATAEVNGVKVLGSGAPIVTVDPGIVRPDMPVTIVGAGFDPGSKIDIVMTTGTGKKAKTTPLATATGDRYGSFYTTIKFPSNSTATDTSTRDITAQQRGAKKVAKSQAQLAAGAAGVAKLSAVVGRPGDTVTLTVSGFSPGEELAVYWGRINGTPGAVLKADSHGAVTKVPIKVGVSAVGTTSVVIVGQKSGAAASLPFQVLKLYPSIALKPYAVKAMNPVGFSGKGFVPEERVLVRLNSAGGAPIMALQTDGAGAFKSGGFIVPYQLKGAQRLVFTGELSGATVSSSFSVLPYMPMARTSTYGGSPGTSISFYGSGFGANEAVHVYAAKGKGAKPQLVGAFRTDAAGGARAVGRYTIPGDAGDAVLFTLVGQRSGGTATVTFKVDNSAGPVDVAPQPPYVLPPDLQN